MSNQSTVTAVPQNVFNINNYDDGHVIVIGAGIAGIAASRYLVDEGYKVTIVEARDRLGGRIWTSFKWQDTPIDMGASWIHGSSQQNPITKLVKQAKLNTVITSYDSYVTYAAGSGEIETEDGSDYAKVYENYENAVEEAYDLWRDQPLRSALEKKLNYEKQNEFTKRLINHVIISEADDEYSGDSAELSAWYWDDGEAYSGEDVLIPQGYNKLIDFLANNLTVKLQHNVSKIEYDNKKGVVVTTQLGALRGSYVILTVPLGVLKKKSITFDPPLPRHKRNAVEKLGMGVLTKVWLLFPEVFWDAEDWIEYIPRLQERGKFHQWVNVAGKTGKPVLVGFLSGSYALQAEGWSDLEIVGKAMEVLKDMYGKDIPQPKDAQISRWSKDPYSYGSYSFNRVNSTPNHRKLLAQPVQNRLFFAGEATHESYYGTVHGAYLTGLSAAEAIMKLG